VEYASGKNSEIYPEDSGVLLQADRKLKSTTTAFRGEEVKAEIEVGMVFYPKGFVRSMSLVEADRATDHSARHSARLVRRDGYQKFYKAARITAFQPHMHIRGKAQCLELIYRRLDEVVSCAHFNYNGT